MSTIRLPDDWATQVYDTLMCGHESPADCHEDIVELITGWIGDIPRTDAGALAFYVRDLMAATGYHYNPNRPVAEQARECDELIRYHRRELNSAIEKAVDLKHDHKGEVQRLTDLVDELRRQLVAALKLAQRHGAKVDLGDYAEPINHQPGPDLGDDPDGDLEGADYPPFPAGGMR